MIGENGPDSPVIGVLALQGGFQEHLNILTQISPTLKIKYIRNASDVTSDISRLILPGGESTTMSLLMERDGLGDLLRELIQVKKVPTFVLIHLKLKILLNQYRVLVPE